MKGRFMLFHSHTYYPTGGIYDLLCRYDTLEEAQAMGNVNLTKHTWVHTYDIETGDITHNFQMRGWHEGTWSCEDCRIAA